MSCAWLYLVEGMLACYPRAWRERFGDQVRADLADAHADQAATPGFPLAKWIMSMALDLAWGAIKAHMGNQKTPVSFPATAGGGRVEFTKGPPDPRRAVKTALRQTLSLLLIWAPFAAGGALAGMWLYDTRQFHRHGVLGAMVVALLGRRLYNTFQATIANKPRNSTDLMALNMQFLLLAAFLCLAYWATFSYLSAQANDATVAGLALPLRGVLTVHPALLPWMTGTCLLASCIGSFGVPGDSTPARVLLGGLLVAVLGGSWATLQSQVAPPLVVGILGLPLATLILIQWRQSPVPAWVGKVNFALATLPIPMLLGFLMALSQDFTRPSQAIDDMMLATGSAPSLQELAMDYDLAIRKAGIGEAPEQFWQQVDRIQQLRDQWQTHKPWMRLSPARPVGISATDWCLRSNPVPLQELVAHCQRTTAASDWLSRP